MVVRPCQSGMLRGSASLVGVALMLAVAGCSDRTPSRDYEVLAGRVEGTRADTSTLLVRVTTHDAKRAHNIDERLTCLVVPDAEIYVNDRLAAIDDLAIGDQLELIGYFDETPPAGRFVVQFAYLQRNDPLPPEPDLTPPAPPATQPTETTP